MKRRPLSKSQMICITLLWAALCYVILTGAKRIDGPVILSIITSAALVFIPIYRSIRKNK
ncbi:hypothetical protein EZS27_009849 [termite gut metagenome]|uniref:Uncharacterized protein n=1 Tax=termite gut metagenome TaxID=433724 RepID=A0A5J4S8F0_9ZZZZ